MRNLTSKQYLLAALTDKVNEGDYEAVHELVNQGADVNGRDAVGDTPLLSAAWVGAANIVRLLIERGADIKAVGMQGKTALQLAEEMEHDERAVGHHEAARILKEAGTKL